MVGVWKNKIYVINLGMYYYNLVEVNRKKYSRKSKGIIFIILCK